MTINTMAQNNSLDLKTPEGVANKLLDFISFEKGEEKDWDEYRNLFLPNAIDMIYRPNPGRPLYQQIMSWTSEEFIRYAGGNYAKEGFEEYTIGMDVKEFNGVATVFQSYYSRTLDGSYESRGVNTYIMLFLEDRWWISSAAYVGENEENRLPDELLFEKYKEDK